MRKPFLGSVLALLLIAAPALAGKDVLTRGADLWHTAAGFSYTSFEGAPIPAGFFCEGSKAFTGVVQLRGEPIATQPAGALGNIDTIVRRLDDARLDAGGAASTRIQLLALSLASVKPVDTGCGLFDVRASLTGEQPITEMKLKRTAEEGGYYIAPLELNVKLSFLPVSGKSAPRELTQKIYLGPASTAVWSYTDEKRSGRVRIDTDGDRTPDTDLPASSNFTIGLASNRTSDAESELEPGPNSDDDTDRECYKTVRSCHCTQLSTQTYEPNNHCPHLHCVWVRIPCRWPDPPIPGGIPFVTLEEVEAMTGIQSN